MTRKIVKTISDDDVATKATTTFIYKQGEWVNLNNNIKLTNVRCLKARNDNWWKLEPEIDAVWYTDSDVLGHSEYEPVMERTGALYRLIK